MKIVMTLLVRDEEDIVAANLDYHFSQGVDFVIATDHRSTDRTPVILKDYERRGLLRYIYEASEGYEQYAWVTRMARLACTDHGADWVINSDADEFWWPVEGTLATTFAAMPADVKVVRARRHNFVAVPSTSAQVYERMIYRAEQSRNVVGRPLRPKVAHRGSAEVEVAQGNTRVSGLGAQKVAGGSIEILHFPIRTYPQFENKIALGGRAYTKTSGLPESVGSTWRELYRDYERDGNIESHFNDFWYDEQRLLAALADGTLVVDRRLADYFEKLGDRKTSTFAAFPLAGEQSR